MLRRAQCWRRMLNAAASTWGPHSMVASSGGHLRNGAPWFSSKSLSTVTDAQIDRHYIAHELAFPLKPPARDADVEAVAQSILKQTEGGTGGEVHRAMYKWYEAGNEVTKELINCLLVKFAARNLTHKGYSLMKWVMKKTPFEVTDAEKSICLHFSKGLKTVYDSESVFSEITEKTDEVYLSLLRALVHHVKRRRSETLFEEMKEAKVITTGEPYELMIDLYLHLDDAQSAMKTFLELEKSGFPPSAFLYKTLDARRNVLQVKGLDDKIKAFLDGLGNTKLKGKDWKFCIVLNAAVGRKQEVERLWNEMKQEGFVPESYYRVAIESFSRVGNMSRFEELCGELSAQNDGIVERQCSLMLKIYCEKGDMHKAEKLLKQVCDDGLDPGYHSYHHLVAGYLKKGKPDKALEKFDESMKTCKKFKLPLFHTTLLALEACAKTKDVNRAEMLLVKLYKTHRYGWDVRIYNALLQVYIAANKPVYGFEERMASAKAIPDATTMELLKKVKVIV